jgi:hypothetical protein
MPETPPSGRVGPAAVRAGRQMIVWGGYYTGGGHTDVVHPRQGVTAPPWELPASLICLAPRLAPRGQECEHTSIFVADAEPHPATWAYLGRRAVCGDNFAKE